MKIYAVILEDKSVKFYRIPKKYQNENYLTINNIKYHIDHTAFLIREKGKIYKQYYKYIFFMKNKVEPIRYSEKDIYRDMEIQKILHNHIISEFMSPAEKDYFIMVILLILGLVMGLVIGLILSPHIFISHAVNQPSLR